jgi:hypothetical protein
MKTLAISPSILALAPGYHPGVAKVSIVVTVARHCRWHFGLNVHTIFSSMEIRLYFGIFHLVNSLVFTKNNVETF